MTTQNEIQTNKKTVDARGSLVAGSILVTIGLGLLLFKWLSLEMLFPAVVAAVFIVAGIVTRSAGLMIPGGIVGGVGMGIVAVENNWFAVEGSQESGGVMLLCMAAGFLSIILLTMLFTKEPQIWPVFPGGALALIGLPVYMGERGIAVLEVIGNYWPAILIVVGLLILLKNWRVRA